MEIERKFWVKNYNLKLNDWNMRKQIIQSYINKLDDFYEIRIREYIDLDYNEFPHNENKYYLDFKSPGDLSREEFGIRLTKEQYDALKPNAKYSLIKTRRYLTFERTGIGDGYGLFLDEYQGDLKGFITLEVEGTEKDVMKFELFPGWDAVEVTYDPRFKNRNLVYHKWKDDIENWGLKKNVREKTKYPCCKQK